MSLPDSWGIILQARIGSARLPGKMLLPFYKDQTLLDRVIYTVKNFAPLSKIVLATGKNQENDVFENITQQHNIQFFRGSETNVLQRFIGAAEKFGFTGIVRVCADNPFIRKELAEELIRYVARNETLDYVSHATEDKCPAIRTHFGFFCEYVRTDALRKISSLTSDPFYCEHVTSYIYSHPDQFRISFLKMPDELRNRRDIRLTVDTKRDFINIQKLYLHLIDRYGPDFSLQSVINAVDANQEIHAIMLEEIARNEK